MIDAKVALFLLLLLPSCAAVSTPALRATGATGATGASGVTGSQEVEWFRSGFYLGLAGGAATANASASDLDEDLASRGHTTMSSLDDEDTGWKVFGGYRFEQPFGVELSIVSLGQVESTINNPMPITPAFLDDVADTHPILGQGVALAGRWYAIDRDRIELALGAGFWVWEAEVDARAVTGEVAEIDEDALDPLLGASLLFDLSQKVQARLEYEKFWMDGDDVDFVSLGVQMKVY